jgi:hypothetical protein
MFSRDFRQLMAIIFADCRQPDAAIFAICRFSAWPPFSD